MPYEVSKVMDLLIKLSEEEDLKLCVTEAAKGAAITGVATFVGAVVAGPVGMAVAGAAGAVFSAATAKNFKPLAIVLKELPASKQRELANRVNDIVSSLEPSDAIALVALVQGSAVVRLQVLDALKGFFTANRNQSIK